MRLSLKVYDAVVSRMGLSLKVYHATLMQNAAVSRMGLSLKVYYAAVMQDAAFCEGLPCYSNAECCCKQNGVFFESLPCYSNSESGFLESFRVQNFGENKHLWVTPLMKKKHTECNLHTGISHLISCRLREGYTIKYVAITKGMLNLFLGF